MKGKGRALPKCIRSMDHGVKCQFRPGKSIACMFCQDTKLKCEQPGMEAKGKSEHCWKQVEEKWP